jgi:hypothetical protein
MGQRCGRRPLEHFNRKAPIVIATPSSSFTVRAPVPPMCAHSWKRRPDCDRRSDLLAYRCELCGARGERRFGTDEDIRVVEPHEHEYWDRGRVRTERDRRRSIYGQLSVDSLISGAPLSFAEVIHYRRKRERADRDR